MCVRWGYIHTHSSDTYTSGMHKTENLWLLLLLLVHCLAHRWIPNGLARGEWGEEGSWVGQGQGSMDLLLPPTRRIQPQVLTDESRREPNLQEAVCVRVWVRLCEELTLSPEGSLLYRLPLSL